jgi:glycosyltransferase involved in cell wall biosynthesis
MSEPVSVILLAHNAAAHVEQVTGRWVGFLNGLGQEYEILIVDDDSTDRTAAAAEPLTQRNPRVRLLQHPTFQGEGAALRTGLAAAQHPLIAHAPCDLQYQPEDVKKLLAEIDRSHLVAGYRVYRQAPGWFRWLGRAYRGLARLVFALSPEPLPGWLGWGEHARHCLARVAFGIRLRDVGCTFRLFRRSVFTRIPIQSDGPFVHVEVLAKANFLGAVMTETPISYRPRPEGVLPEWAWADVRKVFKCPDFGPPLLPEGPPALPP